MNIHSLLLTIAAIACFLVGFFVYPKKKSDPILKTFSWVFFCVAAWNVEMAGLIGASDEKMAVIWGKIFRHGLLFLPPLLLHFTVLFVGPPERIRRTRKLLGGFYGVSIIWAVMNWTSALTGEAVASPSGFRIRPGPLYLPFILQFMAAILLSFFFIIRGFMGADRYQRHRLKYFFLAMAVSLFWGLLNFSPLRGL
ncbi:MAG: hypothetical protein NTY64_20735, partial [Deltaproteobacteria bacterium]|nr:hypothetical protein [Deltaproteobacteria bacterium]